MFEVPQSGPAPQKAFATACIQTVDARLRECGFARGSKERFACGLLLLNLSLQLFDGLLSHHVLAQNVPEMNPLVDTMIRAYGMSLGLLLAKSLAAALLALVFSMRRKQPALVIKGLSLTAAIYGMHSLAWCYELLR